MAGKKRTKYGDGSVVPRRNKQGKITSWQAQVYVPDPFTGRSKKVTRSAPTKEQAQDLLKELRESPKDKVAHSSVGLTVVDWLHHYEQQSLPVKTLKKSTKANHRRMIRHPLVETLGNVRLAGFDTATAEQWLGRLHECKSLETIPLIEDGQDTGQRVPRELASSTKRNAFYVLKSALSIAVRDGVIAANPLSELPAPSNPRVEAPYFSPSEFDKSVRPALKGSRLQALVEFLYATGCRLGEALGLRWNELDQGTARVMRSASDETSTKTGKRRAVEIVTQEAIAALRAWKKSQAADRLRAGSAWQDSDGLVFTTRTGLSPDTHSLRRDFQAVLKKARIEKGHPFHALRHGFAHRQLAGGLALHEVSALMGHASYDETMSTYGHLAKVDYAAKARQCFAAAAV